MGEGAADNSLFGLNGMKITQTVLLMTDFFNADRNQKQTQKLNKIKAAAVRSAKTQTHCVPLPMRLD